MLMLLILKEEKQDVEKVQKFKQAEDKELIYYIRMYKV